MHKSFFSPLSFPPGFRTIFRAFTLDVVERLFQNGIAAVAVRFFFRERPREVRVRNNAAATHNIDGLWPEIARYL